MPKYVIYTNKRNTERQQKQNKQRLIQVHISQEPPPHAPCKRSRDLCSKVIHICHKHRCVLREDYLFCRVQLVQRERRFK